MTRSAGRRDPPPRIPRFRVVLHAFAGLAACGSVADLGAQAVATSEPVVAETIRHITDTAHHPYLKWPDFPHYRDEMEGLYGPRAYRPLWFNGERPTRRFRTLVDQLLVAEARGLNPTNYDAAVLDSLWREHEGGGRFTPDEIGLIDASATIAILRHISDLHVGRVNPRNISIGLDIESKKYDLVAVVGAAIEGDRIAQTIAEAEPDIPSYHALKEALAHYHRLAAMPPVGAISADMVSPGDAFADLHKVAELLIRFGDLETVDAPPAGATRYDGAVPGAVARYQYRHGLSTDSIIGPGTLEELNTPMMDRVHQIEWALERYRWLPSLADAGPFIAVNIPAFRLWAFDRLAAEEDAAVEMRVIVGKAINTQTPVFIEDLRYLVFAPYWNVPYNIAVTELLPAARGDPDYMIRNRYELVPEFDWGATVYPSTEENLAKVGSGALKIRQQPGPSNSLGLVKFIFPNAMGIYLHSTPARQLFARARRDFSHGCIRVEHAVTLADWVLKNQGDWTEQSIEAAMNAGRPSRESLQRPLPVIIFYTTALVERDGTVLFWDDIYGHDEILENALAQGYPYPP
ncbi:MAG: L,D-transpeptidase family protein [Gemmatimonadota bacterium]|nr:L,D-transpeptidase family protein [Gemmatimonadota bacterium]